MGYKKEKRRINKKWNRVQKRRPNLEPIIEVYRGLDLGFLRRKEASDND